MSPRAADRRASAYTLVTSGHSVVERRGGRDLAAWMECDADDAAQVFAAITDLRRGSRGFSTSHNVAVASWFPIASRGARGLKASDRTGAVAPIDGAALNLTLAGTAVWHQVTHCLAHDRLGVRLTQSGRRTVIDYSEPNIAKEMHVGHLRTMIIGDYLARVLGFLSAEVIRRNHLGDWGTQFGG